MTDYATDIKDLLEDNWTTSSTLTFTPVFDVGWETQDWGALERICVHELGSNHEILDLSNALHRITGRFQVDCWASDRSRAILMRDEVDRIINATTSTSITGIKLLTQSVWRDGTDFMDRNQFRMICELSAISFMDS